MKDNLNFKWDKNEENFINNNSNSLLSTNSIKDVEYYLDFLVEIKPAQYHHIENNTTTKFSL